MASLFSPRAVSAASSQPVLRAETSDEQLMARVAQGETQAFTELVERYSRRAFAVAWRLLFNRSLAEEMVQEAWTKVWVSAASWNPERGKFSTWFYRLLTNACIDQRRKKQAQPLDEAMELVDTAPGEEEKLQQRAVAQAVAKSLSQLPERQQLALTLCYYEEFSNRQAAEIMGIHLKALEGLLSRARATLRERLAHLEQER